MRQNAQSHDFSDPQTVLADIVQTPDRLELPAFAGIFGNETEPLRWLGHS